MFNLYEYSHLVFKTELLIRVVVVVVVVYISLNGLVLLCICTQKIEL